jgi:hypothetical protein
VSTCVKRNNDYEITYPNEKQCLHDKVVGHNFATRSRRRFARHDTSLSGLGLRRTRFEKTVYS